MLTPLLPKSWLNSTFGSNPSLLLEVVESTFIVHRLLPKSMASSRINDAHGLVLGYFQFTPETIELLYGHKT